MQQSPFNFFNVTFLILLVLKLVHLIDISWWWVTAPMWGGILLIMLCQGAASRR